ncbi:uncharacterized protein LOC133717007 [Rosa rugosa]|uniref:uncharacterized protein LOC133717007 n=1 Tax=Rosa rugosa TaxID=74645 RepID=UPI002B404C05|nr:uncharacterized protein LOC133717007 [Rosa rugosa]
MSAMIARREEPRNAGQENSSWNNRNGGKMKDGRNSGVGVECQVCGKKGHIVDTCFKVHKCQICGKHGHLTSTCYQNPDYKPQQGTQASSLNSGPSPEYQICSKKGHTAANCFYRTDVPAGHPSLSIPTCQICGLKGHVALNCSHRTNFAYQGSEPPASLAALIAQNSGNHSGVPQQP